MRMLPKVVRIFFLVETAIVLVAIILNIYASANGVMALFAPKAPYGSKLLVLQLISSLAAGAFAIYGAYKLRYSRVEAYEQFRRATLINLLLTEFFIFSRTEFAALPGFFAGLALLGLINYAIYQEKRLRAHKGSTSI